MLNIRSYSLGIFIGFILISSSVLFVSCQGSYNDVLYLNKVAVCTFEVGYSIDIENKIAYITDNKGVIIIEVENPYTPKKIGRITIADGAFGLEIKNNIAYIAGDSSGLVIANVSNQKQPGIIGQLQRSGSANCIAIHENICYLGFMNSRIDIINITDLSNPSFLTSISGNSCNDLVVQGEFLYRAGPNSGLTIFNISNPVNAIIVKSLSTLVGAFDISINNGLLYLGCHMYGIKIINITNPYLAQIIGSSNEDDGGEALGVIWTESFLGVADNYGVELFNVSNPVSISKEAEFRRGISAAHDIAAVDRFLYVAKGQGLSVFEISNTNRIYFPAYLYYIIPCFSVLILSAIAFIIYRKKMKVKKEKNMKN